MSEDELFFDVDEENELEENEENEDNVKKKKEKGEALSSMRAPQAILNVIVPPMNFAMVNPGIYRSGYPNRKNFSFLLKLKIKTVLYVGLAAYVGENEKFLQDNGIRLIQCPSDGNQEPFISISFEVFQEALKHLLGKHQTGCMVGCIRKVQQWGLMSIFEEYKRFCGARSRSLDYQFIELFQPQHTNVNLSYLPSWATASFCP